MRKSGGSVRSEARTEGTVVNSNEQYFRFGFSLLCEVRFGPSFFAWFGSDEQYSRFGSSVNTSVRIHEQYSRFGPS